MQIEIRPALDKMPQKGLMNIDIIYWKLGKVLHSHNTFCKIRLFLVNYIVTLK